MDFKDLLNSIFNMIMDQNPDFGGADSQKLFEHAKNIVSNIDEYMDLEETINDAFWEQSYNGFMLGFQLCDILRNGNGVLKLPNGLLKGGEAGGI
ncbi:MAG: hypothetical protein HDR11_05055 [Lachnospiraceae bacterium]|nr:hypothetical protein [Lachnospiraceae bacterium]